MVFCKHLFQTSVPIGVGLLWLIAAMGVAQEAPKNGGWAGKIADAKAWDCPNTLNGLMPDQNWHCVSTDPNGDVYVGGMDHSTNAALYRLSQKDDTLRWVGDAKQASTDANNWQSGESCQKFHMHPTYHDGNIWVASTDRTDIGPGYLQSRGFHWYRYDIAKNKFIDVSAQESSGVALPHLQIVTITVDPIRNLLYGMSNSIGYVVKHDIALNKTWNLQKPSSWTAQQYIYVDRFLWCDSRGRVYISAGNERAQWYMGENKTVYNNLYYYDVASNQMGKAEGFALQGANSIECGAWNREHTKIYVSSDLGQLYCFDDSAQTWTYLGRPDFAGTGTEGIKVWSIQVTPNGRSLYVGRCDNADGYSEFDLATKTSKPVFSVKELDDKAASFGYLTGYDTWDRNGNIYFAMHSMWDGKPVVLVRANTVKIKVAKGMLPELVLVSAHMADNSAITVSRSGATTKDLEVLYDISAYDSTGKVLKRTYGRSTIAAAQASQTIQMSQLNIPSAAGAVKTLFDIVPDGCEYLAGADRTIPLAVSAARQKNTLPRFHPNSLESCRNAAGKTVLRYFISAASGPSPAVRLALYDLSGKCTKVVTSGRTTSGRHELVLDNAGMARGLYLARLIVDGAAIQRTVVVY
jgi:hypothetical protein